MEATAHTIGEPAGYEMWVAREFSPYPSGRTHDDGPNNAQSFVELLVPRLAEHPRVILNLDGLAALPTSFLQAVFQGLMRSGAVRAEDVCKRIELQTSEPELEIYIPMAKQLARQEAEALTA